MTIRNWEGIAIIIGAGDICKNIRDYLITIAPKLEVKLYGRDLKRSSDIYLDLEDEDSFSFFVDNLSILRKLIRMVINTSGFLHSKLIKPEKRLSHVNRSKISKNFTINAFAPILIAKSIEQLIQPELPFLFKFKCKSS